MFGDRLVPQPFPHLTSSDFYEEAEPCVPPMLTHRKFQCKRVHVNFKGSETSSQIKSLDAGMQRLAVREDPAGRGQCSATWAPSSPELPGCQTLTVCLFNQSHVGQKASHLNLKSSQRQTGGPPILSMRTVLFFWKPPLELDQ